MQWKLLGVLKSLTDRSLIEISEAGFSLQPMVMEYITEKLANQFSKEIVKGVEEGIKEITALNTLNSYTLVPAQTRDCLVRPLLDKLCAQYGSTDVVKRHLKEINSSINEDEFSLGRGYAIENFKSLLQDLEAGVYKCDSFELTRLQNHPQNLNLPELNQNNLPSHQPFFTDVIENLGDILSISYSNNGEFLAAGDNEGRIHLWQVSKSTGSLTKEFSWEGHSSWVRAVAFSPDNRILVSSSNDRIIKFWDINSPDQCLQELPSKEWVRAVAFSSDGRMLATGSDDYHVVLWSVSTQENPPKIERLRTLDRNSHLGRVRAVAFSPDSQLLASGGDDQNVKLWHVSTFECIANLKEHQDRVRAVAFSPDGQLLASGSDDRTIKLWNVLTDFNDINECVITLDDNQQKCIGRVQSVLFSPDGQTLASGNDNQTLKLWGIDSHRCLKMYQGYTKDVRSLIFADHNTLLSGHDDHTVKVWDLREDRCIKLLVGHSGRIRSLSLSGEFLASGSDDCTFNLWNIATGQCLQTSEKNNHWVRAVAFSPDGKSLAVAGDNELIKLWPVQKGKIPVNSEPKILPLHAHWIRAIAFSSDGQMLASGGDEQIVRLFYNITSEPDCKELGRHEHRIRSVAFSPDNQILASGSDDGTIKLWDVSTRRQLTTLEEPDCMIGVKFVIFSPDGKLLASGSDDGFIRLWDFSTKSCHKLSQKHPVGVQSLAFSPNGNTLASGTKNGEIKLWDISTGECWKTLNLDSPTNS